MSQKQKKRAKITIFCSVVNGTIILKHSECWQRILLYESVLLNCSNGAYNVSAGILFLNNEGIAFGHFQYNALQSRLRVLDIN